MRIAVLGTTPMTIECILEFVKHGWEVAAVVSLPEDKQPLNSVDLKRISDEIGAVYYETDDLNGEKSEAFLSHLDLDYIFSTWPFIINERILNVPRYFVIGSHPTQLPYNRGRHPLHWLICMGIRESYMSLFVMDSGVDSGNILIQETYSCAYDYGIQDVYENMIKACRQAIGRLCCTLEENPAYRGEKQNRSEANYWRKRNIFDVMIDFRMSALDIVRLVKSFNPPYECAVLLYKSEMLRIANARIIPSCMEEEKLQRLEAGKVLEVKKHCISVKASDQIVELEVSEKLDLTKRQFGNYIYPPAKYVMEEPDLFQKLQKFV